MNEKRRAWVRGGGVMQRHRTITGRAWGWTMGEPAFSCERIVAGDGLR